MVIALEVTGVLHETHHERDKPLHVPHEGHLEPKAVGQQVQLPVATNVASVTSFVRKL